MSRKREPRIRRLNEGGILRQRNTVKVRAKKEDARFNTKVIGHGNFITGLEFDDTRNLLTITKSQNANNASLDSVRAAAVQGTLSKVDDIPEVDSWFDDGTGSTDRMLPIGYAHGDPLPSLPAGLSWVRLNEGSMRAGLFSWDADVDEADLVRTDELKSKSANPFRAEAILDDDDNLTIIKVYYDQPIELAENLNANALAKLIRFNTDMGSVHAISVSVEDNILAIGLDRQIDIRENIYVQVMKGVLSSSADSNMVPVVGRGARFCYVVVVNRQRAGRDLSEDEGVVLSSVQRVKDTNNNTYPVYDIAPLGGEGGGGTTFALGKVIGGNSHPLDDSENQSYPAQKNNSFPLPYLTGDGEALNVLPEVENWDELTLPDTYQIGDTLPGTPLPAGLCYVQLARPYSLLGSSWDSAVSLAPESSDSALTLQKAGVDAREGLDLIILTFNKGGFYFIDDVGSSSFDVTVTDQDGNDVSNDFAVQDFEIDGRTVVLRLSSVLDPDEHSVQISISEIVAIAADEEEGTEAETNTPETGFSVSYIGDKYTMVFALNRQADQMFTFGTLVLLNASAISVTDENGVSRQVVDIVGPVSTAQVHDHADFTSSGLGRSSISVSYPMGTP
ncbi:MAG: hypothetical protein GF334_12375 [Candidatus Altiarchaeales archaeon]|nr:hypothetical protein [Candidatus Altiarchaeales archaeon]